MTKKLSIEVVECLTVLGVVDITGLNALIEDDVSVVIPAVDFVLWCHFFMRVVMVHIGADP